MHILWGSSDRYIYIYIHIYIYFCFFCLVNFRFIYKNDIIYIYMFDQIDLLYRRCWFKGADTSALCLFMESCLAKHLEDQTVADEFLNDIYHCFSAANRFKKVLYASGLWLSLDKCQAAAQAGLDFLRLYLLSSHRAYALGKTRFKLTPKFHACIPVVDGLVTAFNSRRRWTLSPLSEGTQMDEDFVGKLSNIAVKVSPRMVHTHTLQRYLMVVSTQLRGEKCRTVWITGAFKLGNDPRIDQ